MGHRTFTSVCSANVRWPLSGDLNGVSVLLGNGDGTFGSPIRS
jgi:hypothetical protein